MPKVQILSKSGMLGNCSQILVNGKPLLEVTGFRVEATVDSLTTLHVDQFVTDEFRLDGNCQVVVHPNFVQLLHDMTYLVTNLRIGVTEFPKEYLEQVSARIEQAKGLERL